MISSLTESLIFSVLILIVVSIDLFLGSLGLTTTSLLFLFLGSREISFSSFIIDFSTIDSPFGDSLASLLVTSFSETVFKNNIIIIIKIRFRLVLS
jgi:hypothetical protein